MRSFEHIDARTVEEACALLAEYKGSARLNAGGTDLLLVLKGDILPDYPKAIINIKNIPDLDHMREEGDVLKIGSLARLADIAKSPLLIEKYPALAEAGRSVASPQIRNAATIGGNLCQDVRCWYYRYPRQIGGAISCARKGKGPCLAVKGDNRYHAIMGGKKCFAVCPSDTAVALAALDARITIASLTGERKIEVKDFFNPLKNALSHDEMIREIEVPILNDSARQHFLKFTVRKPVDFALVSVAAAVAVKNDVCASIRLALGAVAPGPVRPQKAEEFMIGRRIDEQSAREAAELAMEGAKPLSRNGYKIEIAKTLVKRAILG